MMGSFFKEWRRKFGVVILLLACFLMVGWLRSGMVADHFTFWVSDYHVSFDSYRGAIHWHANDILHFWPQIFNWPHSQNPIGAHYFSRAIKEPRRTTTLQVEYTFQDSLWSIPYWALIIPLAVVSLWLLIVKPRKSSLGQVHDISGVPRA